MFENVKTVIFDVDGTMVDSVHVWKTINTEFFGQFGILLDTENMRQILSLGFDDAAEYCSRNYNIPYTANEVKNIWNEKGIEYYSKQVTLKDGFRELLENLKSNNFKIGVATNNSKKIINFLFQKENILKKFDIILTSEDVQKRKPDPEMFVKIANHFGTELNNCLVFEDSKTGMMAAKIVGMKVCAVLDKSLTSKNTEIDSMVDYSITSFRELKI
ncbi:MAG: hypothetical protein A2Y24_00105 [Clostridiales bacterium GWE2_32_10]|nr:MAG: hypothetical protein A2Y24_00105 [Clostridiales bacterium GWE2_32_10]